MPHFNPGSIIISLKSTSLDSEEQQILNHKNIGGVILFTRNFESKPQIIELVTAIKQINPNVIIMIDHEGGRVWRFKNEEFTNPGPMQPLVILYDTEPHTALTKAYQYGYQIASDLLQCGIDLNLAPVIDLNHDNISSVIGERAFHSNPTIVAELATQFIKGQQDAGMQAVGKHFPGHGAILADSHLTTAIDQRKQEEIFDQDLKAFRLLIEHNSLPAIMPAHVIYQEIDSKPAGCSRIWLQDILRGQLNFNGAIISDCLSMQAAQEFALSNQKDIDSIIEKLNAINQHPTQEQAINLMITKEALQAGCDLVIFNKLYDSDLKHLLDNLDTIGLQIQPEQLALCIERRKTLIGYPKSTPTFIKPEEPLEPLPRVSSKCTI